VAATGLGTEILALTRDLCEFATGVVAADNERFFARVAEEVPLEVHRYASGSEHNGWRVPDLWRVERATISRGGRLVHDAAAHVLGVATYSQPFTGELELDELRRRLVSNPELPEAIVYHCMWQYRPWDAEWALCVPHEVVAQLEPGRYEVELATTYEPGEMLVGVAEHAGRSERTVVLNAHTCHPHMANDDFAGVAVAIRLFQWLQSQETEYSYRLVLGPEHLGTVFYLRDLDREELARLVCGIFVEMPGTAGPVTIASTFLGGQPLDLALANAAAHHARASRLVPWRRGAGNDETVWEAPGYEVPFAEVSRSESLMAPYREYHTSLDTPELMEAGQLEEFGEVLRRALEALEHDCAAHRLFDGLVALSSPRYRLYRERADPAVLKSLAEDSEQWGYLADSLLRYFDGSSSVLEIAERHELPFDAVLEYVRRFEEKGLVELEHRALERVPISRRRG
jgi:aminopeptidase-like protein